ncbi:E3 ubiquitin-protein ligase TRIM45-like isoform X2 [Babylonia areolata]|uniref:E3 ubiquitin-protein ligase TRIM45-like isoform X2 n=1 Tax=Babylonia areolata TaxID=304850 RepID=UPI003FD560E7
MATAAAQDDDPRDTECIVCHELLTVPKILPCGHLLCRHCLLSWLKTPPDAKCPVCRFPILDAQRASQESLDDVVDTFPTHLLVEAIVEAERVLSKQHTCCVCVDVAAVSLCTTCGDMFCQACCRVHEKQSATKHHNVESLTSLSAASLASRKPTTCSAHVHELAVAYCPAHAVSVCVLCATTDHRQCAVLKKVETRVEESRALLTRVAATLKAGEEKLDKAITEVEENISSLDRQTDAGVSEVEAIRQRLVKAVDARCHQVKEKILSTSSHLRDKMEAGKAVLMKQRARFGNHSRIVQEVERSPQHGLFSDMTSTMEKCVGSLDCSDKLLTSVMVKGKVTLTIDPEAVTRIEQELSQMDVSMEDSTQVPVLRFHDNHGRRIRLSNNRQTAQRTDTDTRDGVVMSRDPMIVGSLYEIGGGWSGLKNVVAGTQLGVALDSSRRLHLYVNGKDQGVVTTDTIPDPCHFMFDLFSRCTQVTARPVRQVPELMTP